jgi:hypothetical protein
MNACQMVNRCLLHQPDPMATQEIRQLLHDEGMLDRESIPWRVTGDFVEQGGEYPGFHRLAPDSQHV